MQIAELVASAMVDGAPPSPQKNIKQKDLKLRVKGTLCWAFPRSSLCFRSIYGLSGPMSKKLHMKSPEVGQRLY